MDFRKLNNTTNSPIGGAKTKILNGYFVSRVRDLGVRLPKCFSHKLRNYVGENPR